MNRRLFIVSVVALAYGLGNVHGDAREKPPPMPIGWAYAKSGPVTVYPKASTGKKTLVKLGRGALLPVFKTREKGGAPWSRVQAVDVAKLSPVIGWIESSQVETFPVGQIPSDKDLLKLLGGAYLDDFIAANTAVARYVVHQGAQEPALVCVIGSPVLPHSRLQVFFRAPGQFMLGPYREFAFADMQAGLTDLEVRDLLGDGNECLVLRETSSAGLENAGLHMVIQRIENGQLETLWKAPLELRNLASFSPKPQLLEPPEKNLGAPATVTTATVEFRKQGGIETPVWKGKISLHALGREEPLETVNVEKVCAWDGSKFAPVQPPTQ